MAGRTRAVEDKLSDALHERLTERFVDRRTSVLMRRMRENTALETDIGKTGEVVVEGHKLGRLDGFTFTPEASAAGSEAKALAGAAQKALAGEIDARAARLAQRRSDDQFVLATDGVIRWQGQPVGRIVAAEEALKPRVRIIADEQLTGAPRDSVQTRLDHWLKAHIEKLLGPLFQLADAEDVTGLARGIAFQLAEALGVIERGKIADDVKSLDQPARASLAQIRRAVRRLSHLRAGAAQAGAARARDPALCAQARGRGEHGPRRHPEPCRLRPHLDRQPTRPSRTISIASPASASAASARCASTSSSGSPTSSARRWPGVRARPVRGRRPPPTASASW